MNLLKNTRVYLAGSMENVTSDEGRSWRNYAGDHLNKLNITVFDPYKKPFVHIVAEDEKAREEMRAQMNRHEYDKVRERMKQVRSDDLRLCDISDFLIAMISPTMASWGTAEEIYTFNRMKKPMFIIVDGGKHRIPVWLLGMLPHKYFYNNIQEVLSVIRAIDCGIKEMDSNRWRLLREEYR